jgi:hypothetical protein
MRTIYIDEDYKCYAIDDGLMRPVETDFFNGKCDAYIEGFRLVPEGDTWTREDGTVFKGLMISPWKDYSQLEMAQRDYERQMMAEYAEALKVLGVTV